MTKILRKSLAAFVVFTCFLFSDFAASSAGSQAYMQGCIAYSQGDWTSAMFMLKKAVAYPENLNADSYFMLINSEIYAGEDKSALDDCDFYLENFPSSSYSSRILYQKGRLLYNLGEYEKSIVVLSDFCHENKKDELYPYALFYIAESLFGGYKYSQAKEIYETIVIDYPDSSKTTISQYRIETISQRLREEKLLYLLKQTGEEYLSAKEEYEKQLRLYNVENVNSTRIKLAEATKKNEELEQQVKSLEDEIAALKEGKENSADNSSVSYNEGVDIPSSMPFEEQSDQLKLLRLKAETAQKMLDSQTVQ